MQTPLVMHQLGDPSKIQSDPEIKWIDILGGNGGEADEISIDQVYLTHIEEQDDFETVEKVKRVRFKGVQPYLE